MIISTYYLENEPLRLLKLLIHEFGHSIGIEHCSENFCVFMGIACIEDLDDHCIFPCVECCCKIAFATNRNLKEQLECICCQFGSYKDAEILKECAKLLGN